MHGEYVIKNFDKYFNDICTLCLECENDKKEKEETVKNMSTQDWENNSSSVLYRIYKKKMFHNGNGLVTLIYDENKIVGISAVERWSDNPKNCAVLAKRLYILKSYRNRNLFHNYILNKQIDWCKENEIKLGIITINEYQKDRALKLVKRLLEGTAKQFINKSPLEEWGMYPNMVEIYDTPQYFIYSFFDPEYMYISDIDSLLKLTEKRIIKNTKEFRRKADIYHRYWLRKNKRAARCK
jgi:hypothetical protein